ncbi:MAG: DUF1707 domain-containing protein [Microlunatus sp.]
MSEPVPQRIGDAERDRAAEYLREHMSVGRLTQEEFDERITAALQARTAADLKPLFDDLPPPRPGQEQAATGSPWPVYQAPALPIPSSPPAIGPSSSALQPIPPMPSSTVANVLATITGIAWILFVLNFIIGPGWWWLVFVPIVLSSVAGKQQQELHRREKLWREAQRRAIE